MDLSSQNQLRLLIDNETAAYGLENCSSCLKNPKLGPFFLRFDWDLENVNEKILEMRIIDFPHGYDEIRKML